MQRISMLGAVAGTLLLALVVGCGQGAPVAEPTAAVDEHDHDHAGHDHADHDHGHTSADGWWCTEHGVPEDDCGLCDVKLAAKMQKEGDWCADHDRPDSQCFACHPELEAKFAAQYEAKYGEKPPKPAG